MRPLADTIYGLDQSSIDFALEGCGLHRDVIKPFQQLQQQAKQAGFELVIASGYRNYERQLLIWNAKASGKRPVLDSNGEPLDMTQLDPWQQVQAILRWSALPGASRHHWGTDMDIYDRAAVADDYQLQLTTAETVGDGPFAPLHGWLDRQINTDKAQGFFRPYQSDIGGIAPERWHLSYAPLSSQYQRAFSIDELIAIIKAQPIALKDVVLENISSIFHRYIDVPIDNYPH
ncbi:M15 family metallopeptidase [Oceanicoccus sagamiensis]|uniref:Peptidase n=1 Tax=Oceanicoccus sagamiensis TaxID=716816 RepID=A0A1X9NAP1_9GAMM|nr:M15 family metallopeptidase [Oceanicoccus sagamiensis]ARN72995.1 peptidase [Oceanicoccus sagamiensis]